MLKKYTRSTIIVLIQGIVPVVLLLIFAPLLIQFHDGFNQVQQFFQSHKIGFLITHITLYLVFLYLWPRIIKRLTIESTEEQMQSALKAKWYLLAVMAFFDLIVWWR